MRLSSQILRLLSQDIVTTFLQFVLSAFIARSIGPAELGALVLFFALIGYSEKLGRIRADDAAIYLIQKKECSFADARRHLFWLSTVHVLPVLIVLGLLQGPILRLFFSDRPISFPLYWVAAAHVPVLFWIINARKLFLTLRATAAYNMTFWLIPFLQLAALPALALFTPLSLRWVLLVSLAAHSTVLLLAWQQLKFLETGRPGPLRLDLLGKMWYWGARYYASSLPQFLQMRIDVLFVAYFLPKEHVAFYSLAASAVDLIWKVPNVLQSMLFPISAGMSRSDAVQFSVNTYRRAVLAVAAAMLAGAAGIYPVVLAVYGRTYLPLAVPFLILLPGAVLAGLGKVPVAFFQAEGSLRAIFKVNVAATAFNIFFNLILIPLWGLHGAAAASCATYAFTGIEMTRRFLHAIHRRWRELVPSSEDWLFYRQRVAAMVSDFFHLHRNGLADKVDGKPV